MSSKTTAWLAVAIIIAVLTCNFVICGYLSYVGTSVGQVGPQNMRAGSVGGPVVGGGPGSGK
jgi:hypothetical protein